MLISGWLHDRKPDGSFSHYETSAPKFINLEDYVADDQIRGNYVRFRAVIENDEEGIKYQNILKTMGAKGVVCNFIRKSSMMEGTASTTETSKIDSLESRYLLIARLSTILTADLI